MKTVFYFVLSDLFYFLPIIKQFKLLDGGLIIWGIIYATAMLALIFWFPLDNLIPSDIPQKTLEFMLSGTSLQILFLGLFGGL